MLSMMEHKKKKKKKQGKVGTVCWIWMKDWYTYYNESRDTLGEWAKSYRKIRRGKFKPRFKLNQKSANCKHYYLPCSPWHCIEKAQQKRKQIKICLGWEFITKEPWHLNRKVERRWQNPNSYYSWNRKCNSQFYLLIAIFFIIYFFLFIRKCWEKSNYLRYYLEEKWWRHQIYCEFDGCIEKKAV